jgi:hypothetical protein
MSDVRRGQDRRNEQETCGAALTADADTMETQWTSQGMTADAALPYSFTSGIRNPTCNTTVSFRSSSSSVTKASDHTLVSAPHRIGSHPPYPSKDDGGHDTIRAHVRSVRPGRPGDVTVGGAAPVHPSPSRARSRRGHAAGRPAGGLWLDTSRTAGKHSTHPARRSNRRYPTGTGGFAGVAVARLRVLYSAEAKPRRHCAGIRDRMSAIICG